MNYLPRILKFSSNRILVVDDEEFCLVSMKVLLKNLGFDVVNQVDFCISGLEAVTTVEAAYKLNLSYSLILSDFHMPQMNGVDATKKIRSFLKSVFCNQPKIIGVTGHATSEYHEKGIAAGMDRVLSKPVYSDELARVLQEHGLIN